MRTNLTKAVLFDLDGTLIEYHFEAREARREIIELLRKLKFDSSKFSVEEHTQKLLEKAKKQIDERKVSLSWDQLWDMTDSILRKYDEIAFNKTNINPNAERVLSRLKGSGYMLGIVTNSNREIVTKILKNYGFSKVFDVIVTRDDVREMKPSTSGLFFALNRLGVRPEESVFVGDSYVDILAARQAGLRVIAVRGGASSRDSLESYGPDEILDDLTGLLSIL